MHLVNEVSFYFQLKCTCICCFNRKEHSSVLLWASSGESLALFGFVFGFGKNVAYSRNIHK